MFMRNYPERITAQRMRAEHRMDKLKDIVREDDFAHPRPIHSTETLGSVATYR